MLIFVALLISSFAHAATPFTPNCKADLAKQMIGLEESRLPGPSHRTKNIEASGGELINDDYAYSTYKICGKLKLFLAKFTDKLVKPGLRESKLVYMMPFPETPQDHSIVIGQCRIGSEVDHAVIAEVKYDEKLEILPVIRTWRADLKTETIVPMPIPEKMICFNESYGE